MECSVDGCGREADYKEKALCQKHYFRQWRYGTVELTRSPAPRHESPQGYQWICAPDHPLRHQTSKYVAEHRAVLYADLGPGPMECELCGKALTWKTCHVDHIDNDVRNNARSNLRPTCCTCNTRRGMRPAVEWSRTRAVEFDGERKTPFEWSKDPRVSVSHATIVRRLNQGMTHEQALFAPKITHNGKKPPPRKRPYAPHMHYSAKGLSMTLAEWSRHTGVTVTNTAMSMRLKKGWDVESAIFTPPANQGQRRLEKRMA